ncbi:hypothetical protein LX83_002842 [Goodfellowiella coeruleoviolacea]|uniref:Uncharacterized protein n=1 Tax=Goodfellowiella coeruleoviolacea TaxID=334858 RepID=A0AAE3KKZ9_9PSEU|nr:hypothetical protein [Goodfellowiella coeruleoviolacea]
MLVRSVLLLVDARTVMQLGVVPVPWFTAFVIVPILVMSSVVAFWVALAVAVCVVDVLLVLPALGLRAGHAWARFVLTLLIVLNLLSSVGSRAPLGLVSLVPDLAVLVLMYLPPAHRHLTRCAAERDRQRRLLRTEFLKG